MMSPAMKRSLIRFHRLYGISHLAAAVIVVGLMGLVDRQILCGELSLCDHLKAILNLGVVGVGMGVFLCPVFRLILWIRLRIAQYSDYKKRLRDPQVIWLSIFLIILAVYALIYGLQAL